MKLCGNLSNVLSISGRSLWCCPSRGHDHDFPVSPRGDPPWVGVVFVSLGCCPSRGGSIRPWPWCVSPGGDPPWWGVAFLSAYICPDPVDLPPVGVWQFVRFPPTYFWGAFWHFAIYNLIMLLMFFDFDIDSFWGGIFFYYWILKYPPLPLQIPPIGKFFLSIVKF